MIIHDKQGLDVAKSNTHFRSFHCGEWSGLAPEVETTDKKATRTVRICALSTRAR